VRARESTEKFKIKIMARTLKCFYEEQRVLDNLMFRGETTLCVYIP
jgi:hypothetical protein